MSDPSSAARARRGRRSAAAAHDGGATKVGVAPPVGHNDGAYPERGGAGDRDGPERDLGSAHTHLASPSLEAVDRNAQGNAAARRRAARRHHQRSRPEIRNIPRNPEERVGELLGGTYRIERLIAVGGMGSVYEVSHTRLEQHFAVKFLDPSFLRDGDAYARFRREAEIASRLNHDNVVQVFDFNTDNNGGVYMVMELVEGDTLDRLLETEKLASRDEVLSIFEPLCDALAACHQHGIVHRDLKPSNIMVRRDGARVRVKLLDFGISKIKEEQTGPATQDNVVMGTPNYMSPEQAQGRNTQLDARTDIFALGAILYEMLSGLKAFEEAGLPQLLHKIVYEQPDPLLSVAPKVSERIVKVVDRCLEKEPTKRYPDVDSFYQDLAAAYKVTPRRKDKPGTAGSKTPRNTALWAATWLVSLGLASLGAYAVAQQQAPVREVAEPAIEPTAAAPRPKPTPKPERPTFSSKLAVPGAHLLSANGQLYRADWTGLAHWTDPEAEPRTRVLPSHAPVRVLTMSNDGHEILVGQADGTVSRWDRGIRERLDVTQFGKAPIEALAGGSGYLVVASGNTVRLMHGSTGKLLKRFNGDPPVAVLLTRGTNPKVVVVRHNELEVIDADTRSALTSFPLEAAAVRAGYIEQTGQGFAKIWIDSDQGEWRVRRTYQLTQVSSKQPLTLELLGQRRLSR